MSNVRFKKNYFYTKKFLQESKNFKFDIIDNLPFIDNIIIKCVFVFFQTFYTLLINLFVLLHFIIIFFHHSKNISLFSVQLENEQYQLYVILSNN